MASIASGKAASPVSSETSICPRAFFSASVLSITTPVSGRTIAPPLSAAEKLRTPSVRVSASSADIHFFIKD